MKKKTMEQFLEEQGMEQMDINDILHPGCKPRKSGGNKNEKHDDGLEQSSVRANGAIKR